MTSALMGLVVALLGFPFFSSGQDAVVKWSVISTAYAACGVGWIVAGTAMIVAGLWTLGSVGRRKVSLWISATAATLAGMILIVGVRSAVIPCGGPG